MVSAKGGQVECVVIMDSAWVLNIPPPRPPTPRELTFSMLHSTLSDHYGGQCNRRVCKYAASSSSSWSLLTLDSNSSLSVSLLSNLMMYAFGHSN